MSLSNVCILTAHLILNCRICRLYLHAILKPVLKSSLESTANRLMPSKLFVPKFLPWLLRLVHGPYCDNNFLLYIVINNVLLWTNVFTHNDFMLCCGIHKATTQTICYAPLCIVKGLKLLSSTLNRNLNGNSVTMDLDENLSAKISFSSLYIRNLSLVTRRDRDVGKMHLKTVSRPRLYEYTSLFLVACIK